MRGHCCGHKEMTKVVVAATVAVAAAVEAVAAPKIMAIIAATDGPNTNNRVLLMRDLDEGKSTLK